MADNLSESADGVKYKRCINIKKLKSCVHERIAENVWNLSAAMDFNKDRYKTANKNVNRLTFVFERQQIHDCNKK